MPMVDVTWYDCVVFCNQLSQRDQRIPYYQCSEIQRDQQHITQAVVERNRSSNGYRLPTEAQWEYSAKAGDEFLFSGSNLIDEVAWYAVNAKEKIHELKQKNPNTWGFYDHSGNAWEWCEDAWNPNAYQNPQDHDPVFCQNTHCERSLRGGSYLEDARDCSVHTRNYLNAGVS